jgi:hypothetical protein
MCSLLVLNLNTSDNGIFHNGESVCIALCNVARQHADDVCISLYIFIPPLPEGGGGILFYLCPSVRPRYFSSHFSQ